MEQLQVEDGYELTENDFPKMIPLEGFSNPYWDPAYLGSVHSDLVFKAKASRNNYTVSFLPGKYGELKGISTFTVPYGSRITQVQIPQVVPFSGYTLLVGTLLHWIIVWPIIVLFRHNTGVFHG